MLGTEGVRLPNPTDGSPGMLKLELAKSEADDILLSEETVHPSLWPALPRGVEVIEGAERQGGVDCPRVHHAGAPSFVFG